MLEHATYLECVPIRLCHDAVQTVCTTLAATNTAKVVDLLEVTFGVDLPTRDNEDHKDDNKEEEVEFVTYEKEEHLPKAGTTTHMAAQSADIAKFNPAS